jgi:ABC-2 type transport system permease protein
VSDKSKDARARKARRLASRKRNQMPVVEMVSGPREVRTVVAELRPPAPRGGLIGALQRPYLIKLLVRRELAKRYSASVLGLLWSYIQPAIRFGVYYVVFGYLLKMHKDVPDFAIHLFCGIVFVHYFSETFGGGTRSIWVNRSMINKLAMPREVFPLSQMLVAGFHTLPQLLLLTGFCLFSGWDLDATGVAAGVLGILVITTFSTALALIFSAVNVYYRDFQNIVSTITQFMHFLVPMMYPLSRVMKHAETFPVLFQIYLANPVATAVILLQRFFWYPVAKNHATDAAQREALVFPDDLLVRGLITLAACLVFLWIAQRVFQRLEKKFPERL